MSKQEPAAWMFEVNDIVEGCIKYVDFKKLDGAKNYQPLYTVSPKRKWSGLTINEIYDLDAVSMEEIGLGEMAIDEGSVIQFARAIEAKLKEKNA